MPSDAGEKEKRRRGRHRLGENVNKRMEKKKEERQEALKKLNLVSSRIVVGATDYRFYEVLKGLAPGDTVVKVLGGDR